MNRDPRQDEIEVGLMRDKNTTWSKCSCPTSSIVSRGVSDAQCGFGLSPRVSRMNSVGLEDVRVEAR